MHAGDQPQMMTTQKPSSEAARAKGLRVRVVKVARAKEAKAR